jgi:hypothetical protein
LVVERTVEDVHAVHPPEDQRVAPLGVGQLDDLVHPALQRGRGVRDTGAAIVSEATGVTTASSQSSTSGLASAEVAFAVSASYRETRLATNAPVDRALRRVAGHAAPATGDTDRGVVETRTR